MFTVKVWILMATVGTLFFACRHEKVSIVEWPEIDHETRPWTRWWWHGNAVNKKDLTKELAAMKAAGIGGVEITPIYGVYGHEQEWIDFLSPQWMDMLAHTLREAEKLDMGVDMATGTGWPFGGLWIEVEDACKNMVFKTYRIESGENLMEPVIYMQEPLVRAVGNQIYEMHGVYKVMGQTPQGSIKNPLVKTGSTQITIDQLVEPISANDSLQALALDQVRFQKRLPLQALMAYSDAGDVMDLTAKVDQNGKLNWTAPNGSWNLYAVFQGWHGKMVERAAPGGEGNVIDHFSTQALQNYLGKFDESLAGFDIGGLRAFFNDSYEVDDASGNSDWTPNFLEEFEKRRGYDLKNHFHHLFSQSPDILTNRVMCDFRVTISDLLLEKFTHPWRSWSHEKQAIIRNQAHGSPANIIDLYVASDIPETEGRDLLTYKLASSATHLSGKRLTSSETSTWLNEHFLSNWSDVKKDVDRFFLGGVNHHCYHGTAYSPEKAEWPGWLFYAAVHFNDRNPMWDDFSALNTYVTRVQSFLQKGKSDNDILVYYPVYDRFSERSKESLNHFFNISQNFSGTSFLNISEILYNRGYSFDYISDRLLDRLDFKNGSLNSNSSNYQIMVLPEINYIPVETLSKMLDLVNQGATLVVHRDLPKNVPGLGNLEDRQNHFNQLIDKLSFVQVNIEGARMANLGKGNVMIAEDIDKALAYLNVRREPMVDHGLRFVRRTYNNGSYYFVLNSDQNPISGWYSFQSAGKSAAIFDPMHGKSGVVRTKKSSTGTIEVYMQLEAGESCIVQTFDVPINGMDYTYYRPTGEAKEIRGEWNVQFIKGGPDLPQQINSSGLGSWTEFEGDAYKNFSGTAKYTIEFSKPNGAASAWLLDLSRVAETARVTFNGQLVATLIGPQYKVYLEESNFKDKNILSIEVSNLMANRIAFLDREEVMWKKFYNVNMPARLRENRNEHGLFTAEGWQPKESGLIGPVTLTALEILNF